MRWDSGSVATLPLHDLDRDDDEMPQRLAGSTLRLLRVDPRELFPHKPAV